MDKSAFLHELRARLYQLSEEDRAKSVRYYSELIADMVEDGYTEAEAIEKLGGPEQVAEQVLRDVGMPAAASPEAAEPGEPQPAAVPAEPAFRRPNDMPDTSLVAPAVGKGSSGKRRWSTAAIILAIVASPIWLPLLIAAGAVALSLFIVIWVLVLVIFAVAIAVLVASFAVVAAAILRAGSVGEVAMLIGVALFCTGCAILVFIAGIYAAKGVAWLTAQCAKSFRSNQSKKAGETV